MKEIPKQNFDFLVKKIELLVKERAELLDIQEKRLTVFSLIVGISISSLGFLLDTEKVGQMGEYKYLIPTVCFLLGLTVFLIGCLTFVRIIQRSLEISFLTNEQIKLINCISCEIEENDEMKLDIFNYSDRFKVGGSGFLNKFMSSIFSLSMIIGLFNSLLFAVFTCFILRFTILEPEPLRHFLPLTGILIYLTILTIHVLYNNKQIKIFKSKHK